VNVCDAQYVAALDIPELQGTEVYKSLMFRLRLFGMDKRIAAFLSLIAWSEGTSTSSFTKDDGYDVLVSGVNGPEVFTDYSDHPFAAREAQVVRLSPLLQSTAAGRYQILFRVWSYYCLSLGVRGFGHATQDAIALQLIRERIPLERIVAGEIEDAIRACSSCWASFPGNGYRQGGHSTETLTAQYQRLISEMGYGQ
jgi:muramidase (phage lysozyme)